MCVALKVLCAGEGTGIGAGSGGCACCCRALVFRGSEERGAKKTKTSGLSPRRSLARSLTPLPHTHFPPPPPPTKKWRPSVRRCVVSRPADPPNPRPVTPATRTGACGRKLGREGAALPPNRREDCFFFGRRRPGRRPPPACAPSARRRRPRPPTPALRTHCTCHRAGRLGQRSAVPNHFAPPAPGWAGEEGRDSRTPAALLSRPLSPLPLSSGRHPGVRPGHLLRCGPDPPPRGAHGERDRKKERGERERKKEGGPSPAENCRAGRAGAHPTTPPPPHPPSPSSLSHPFRPPAPPSPPC